MKRFAIPGLFSCLLMALLSTGCTHTLEVKTLNNYQSVGVPTLGLRPTVGITSGESDIATRRLVAEVGSELSKYADVMSPYTGGKPVDFVADISVAPDYKGSGMNFLINWPGFIVFAPAWHGYIYNVRYNVGVSLTRPPASEVIDTFQLPIFLDVRHAAINRTWTEISWLEVSAIAFAGGCVFIRYDDGVTPLLLDKVEHPLGTYISKEIVRHMASAPPLKAAVVQPVEPSKLEQTNSPPVESVTPPVPSSPAEPAAPASVTAPSGT